MSTHPFQVTLHYSHHYILRNFLETLTAVPGRGMSTWSSLRWSLFIFCLFMAYLSTVMSHLSNMSRVLTYLSLIVQEHLLAEVVLGVDVGVQLGR